MLRTSQSFTDDTVILAPGDHRFVRHRSSVHYSTARWFSIQALQRAYESGHCSFQADMSGALLERVREGLMRSPFTVNAIRHYCAARFGASG
ncbi:hypothetical protein JXA88_03175 [Candidatus Fermentibacteria bacterium]|nr:hypothetical protein [Candidatus Fermentibacteria bacterium]